MTPRSVAAATAALLLLLAGCGDGTRTRTAGPDAPVFSRPAAPTAARTPAPATPTPGPPSPAATAGKRPEPTPSPLPAGLRRTTGSRAVALTFDDGPDPVWTPKVLDQLRKAKVTATFCVVGTRVRRHPALVARIVREGHQLCNHSWQHDVDLGGRSAAAIRADLERTHQAIQMAAPGVEVPFYRQPGGRWTPEVVSVARRLGMRSLHWSVDPQDWAKPPAGKIVERVRAAIRPGSVVLLHDGGGNRGATLAACPALIAEIKGRYGVTRLR